MGEIVKVGWGKNALNMMLVALNDGSLFFSFVPSLNDVCLCILFIVKETCFFLSLNKSIRHVKMHSIVIRIIL